MKSPTNLAKSRMKRGESVLSCTLGIPHPTMIELLALGGFDSVTIDCEHSAISIDSMEPLLLASKAAGITPFWRAGRFDEADLKRALDVGYTSFVVPHIRNAEDADRILRAARYFPRGTRGVGPGRPIRYGIDDPSEYYEHAEDEVLVALMIEEPEAIDDIENIVRVEGIQMVQLGFWDLSVKYGVPFEERHPKMIEIAERVLAAALPRGVWVGVPPVSAEDMAHWESKGALFFECASASSLFTQAAGDTIRRYRAASIAKGSHSFA